VGREPDLLRHQGRLTSPRVHSAAIGTDQLTEYYNAYWGPGGTNPGCTRPTAVLETLDAHTGGEDRLLDFGCGDGRNIGAWLAERVGSYVGVDISAVAVEGAAELGLDARRIDSEREIPLPDGSFDVVACLEVFEHLVEPHRAASEIFRVLRPGGTLIATVPNVAYWRFRLDLALFGRWDPLGDGLSVERPWRDPHLRFFTKPALIRMLACAGFVETDIRGCDGALLADIPLLRRFSRGRGSPPYRALERWLPSILSRVLLVVTRRPVASS
jgi:SAM-dependent methyltransferase